MVGLGFYSITAASVIALVPYSVINKITTTCSDGRWPQLLCQKDSCDYISPLLLTFFGVILSLGGKILSSSFKYWGGGIVEGMGHFFIMLQAFIVWVQAPVSLNVTVLLICTLSILNVIFGNERKKEFTINNNNNKITKPTIATTTTAGDFNLFMRYQ